MVSALTKRYRSSSVNSELHFFLKEWFSSLMRGIEKMNDETWPKILEITGRACALAHSCDLFMENWEKTKNLDEFLFLMNKQMKTETYEKLDENSLIVSYSECRCPLVTSGLVDSPIICECSPNWLIENFETILNTSVAVTTISTILRGGKTCEFILSF